MEILVIGGSLLFIGAIGCLVILFASWFILMFLVGQFTDWFLSGAGHGHKLSDEEFAKIWSYKTPKDMEIAEKAFQKAKRDAGR